MNAEYAGKLIGKFIEKSYPRDEEDIYQILVLGINKAWQQGKWLGMTAEFTVPIHIDSSGQSYVMAPPSHPILLAMNGISLGLSIRDRYFMFHRNGYGDVRDYTGCKWNKDVYDLGYSPYYDDNRINFNEGVRIGVRSIGPSGPNEKININGAHLDGKKIFTYTQRIGQLNNCSCIIGKDKIDTVNGIELSISESFNYISNITFGSIEAITKSATRSPVEIIAILPNGSAYPIARLDPNQRFSAYRKYLVPDALCGKKSLHGLFKIGKQELISSPTDSLIISNDEALIALAKGIYSMYYKEKSDEGAAYILQGISVLEKEKREEESSSEFPIQVDHSLYEDLSRALRYYH